MSWTVKRHFVAKKVLAKHQGDLDRQHEQLDSFRKEDVKELQKELKGINSPRKKGSDVNSPRRGTLPEVDLHQSFGFPMGINENSPPYTERLDTVNRSGNHYHSRRRQSAPATDILSGLRAGDKSNRDIRHLDPHVNAEFQQFLQRSHLGIYGKENRHDGKDKAKSLENIPEYDKGSPGEVNVLNLEGEVSGMREDSDGEINVSSLGGGGKEDGDTEGPEICRLEQLHLEPNVPSYATSRRRMSLPVNGVMMPRYLTDSRFHKDAASAPTNSKLGNRRASSNLESVNSFNQKYLNTRRGSWHHQKNGINVTFVDEYTGESNSGRYAVPDTFRDSPAGGAGDVSGKAMSHLSPQDKKIWEDVAKCRYIRGYDPPEMRMPSCGPNVYVFGRNLGESVEADLQDKSSDPIDTPRPTKRL